MVQPVSLSPRAFFPTTTFRGNEPATVVRGKNTKIRGSLEDPRIENYLGS